MWAVVPVKDMTVAKQRLADVLAADERLELFHAMLSDVLGAIATAPLDGVLVVTRDARAAALARDHGARVLDEARNDGQTAAVARAAALLAEEGTGSMVTIPGDVPLVTAAEIGCVRAAHGEAPAMTIVPADDGRGSNCIVCSPPTAVPLRFGNDSFRPHLAAARERGIEPRVVRLPGLGLDVDTPADLMALLTRPAATRSHAYLEASGITARLTRAPAAAMGAVPA